MAEKELSQLSLLALVLVEIQPIPHLFCAVKKKKKKRKREKEGAERRHNHTVLLNVPLELLVLLHCEVATVAQPDGSWENGVWQLLRTAGRGQCLPAAISGLRPHNSG